MTAALSAAIIICVFVGAVVLSAGAYLLFGVMWELAKALWEFVSYEDVDATDRGPDGMV